MAQAGPTQCAVRWHSVLPSFDKEYEILTANNPEATREMDLVPEPPL
jgi:hypothetical protein